MKLLTKNSRLEWALLALSTFSGDYAAGQIASLLRIASVPRDTIRLSDLLPPDAPNQLRQAGEQIELGRTPQCHTIRVFEPSDIAKVISSLPALGGLTPSGPVSVRRTCFPIRRDAVLRAISGYVKEKGIALTESPMHWNEIVDATKENPVLQVEQVLPDPARAVLQFRLRCMERAVCSSFWVAVPARQGVDLPSPATSVVPVEGPVLVKSGQRALLVFDQPPMRIQLWVTCLQRGSLGKQIRVMDPFTHRVFEAEVTGAGTLMARL
jgi:hypothetical protein